MDYRKFGDTYVVRMDIGEEILADLKLLSEKENIKLAGVQGLGAVDAFEVGVFDLEKKTFTPTLYTGLHEITSLVGTIDTLNGAFNTHLHMSAARAGTNEVIGGHLKKAVIGVTAEILVRVLPGRVDRTLDESINVNILDFNKE